MSVTISKKRFVLQLKSSTFLHPLREIEMPSKQKLKNLTNQDYENETIQKESYWEASWILNTDSTSKTQHQQLLRKIS